MRTQVTVSLTVLVVVAVLVGALEACSAGPTAGFVTAAVALVLVGALAAWSFRRGRHTPWDQARQALDGGRAVVLWKPGCFYCERLQHRLGSDPRVVWVNVWRDDDANREVRRLNNGDEYTPTVLLSDRVLRNPGADDVRAAVAELA